MSTRTFFEDNIKPNHRDAYWKEGKVYILNREGYDLGDKINWLDDPFNHRSWRWLFNNFKWIDTLLYQYLNEGDMRAAAQCADYFFSWYEFYIEGARDGEFLWKDDAVSFRAFRVAFITQYILSSPDFSDEKKKAAKHAIKLHYNELIDEKKFRRNNHGLFQVRGLMTLSTIHSDILDSDNARIYAAQKIDYLWLQQYGKQGIHLENSTGYHQYIIKEFDEVLKSPEFKDCKFIYGKEDIEKVIENTKYFFHPNGSSTLFGDSNLSTRNFPRFTGDKIFNEAGYAFFAGHDETEKNSYLAVRTGFPSNIHRHSDDFSFEWSENGQVILQDSGRYSYEYKNPYRVFLTSTRAHNTVTVNNKNYPWWGEFKRKDFYEGAVKSYEGNSESANVVLEKNFDSLGVQFSRELNLVRGHSLTVTDNLKSKEENSYEQWFHLEASFTYYGENEVGNLVFRSKTMKLIFIPPSGVKVLVSKGQESPFIQGWVSYKEKKILPRVSIGFIVDKKMNFIFKTKIEILPFKNYQLECPLPLN